MKKPLAPNPAIWGNLDTTPALPSEPAKPAKKYLSLEEVEAQLLASQRPAQQPVIPAPPPQHVQIQPQLPSGPPVPQHVGQQQLIEEKPQSKPSQYRRGPQPKQQQFSPRQGQFRPPQGAQRPSQRSPQQSPVRQTHVAPSQRPPSYTGPPPPPNFQEIMAAENQRLLAEDAKRRKRNQKITEMVCNLPLLYLQ